MAKRYNINHYNNFGELYLEIAEPRIKDGEDITNELNKYGEGCISRNYASFSWKGEKYFVAGDSTLEAIQKGYLQYLEKGDEAFYDDDETTVTCVALRAHTDINRFHVYDR